MEFGTLSAPRLSIARTIRDTVRVIARAWITLYGFALVDAIAGLPPAYLFLRITQSFVPDTDWRDRLDPISVGELFAAYVVWLLVSAQVFRILIEVSYRVLDGRPVDWGSGFESGFSRYAAVLACFLILHFALLLGFVLFLVPGLIVYTVYGPARRFPSSSGVALWRVSDEAPTLHAAIAGLASAPPSS